MAAPEPDRPRQKNVFVLCFDGTGNRFSGTESDSNILKLYRMLDRTDTSMYTFYQPGIGTYITSHSMQTTSTIGRIRSWYVKTKDAAVGSSFAEHVMGGYTFLMRYYSCEDDLYFFGFSRGAYTARFLAEMLDQIGLLAAGNEELIRFAWKTYAKWAARTNDGSEKAKKEELKQFEFMRGFRETFSRPVRRIRFLGLFDTVNSVPRFESAWMQRSKFPYTARSTAKVIRHAVSIDERRAKFRQDLIGEDKSRGQDAINESVHRYNPDIAAINKDSDLNGNHAQALSENASVPAKRRVAPPLIPRSTNNLGLGKASSQQRKKKRRRRWSEPRREQDIEEVWFAGGHGDIGGGWTKADGEKWMLSHAPLVWMVHEAERAGLKFDPRKMHRLDCCPDAIDEYGERSEDTGAHESFHQALEESYTKSLVHDCLTIGGGLPRRTVAFWKMMEYLPFRQMDLQNGQWKAIRW